MKNKKIIEILIVWTFTLGLLWLGHNSNGLLQIFLSYAIPVYFVLVSTVLVRFVHKKSIAEHFGLQKWRYLAFAIIAITLIAASYLSGIIFIGGLSAILISPVTEEFFFRGYILGSLKTKKSPIQQTFMSILFVSFIFSLSHIFIPNVTMDALIFQFPTLGILCAFLYWTIGSIIPPLTAHVIWNFAASTSMNAKFSINFWFWVALIILPNVFLILERPFKNLTK